jgi:uncharacterized membrane protein
MGEPHAVRPEGSDEHIEPLFYPARKIDNRAPLRWLAKGWRDMRAALGPSMAYGAGLMVTGYVLILLAWDGGHTLALFTLVTGLVLVGPVLAFGLYSISRQLEMGLPPRLGYCFRESRTHLRNELLFALVLLIILLVWARAASMVHIFMPLSDDIGLIGWLQFLAVGSAVGAIFAGIVFTAAAFSLPMMLDRGTDAITSALTSANAVFTNKGPMLVWAALIFGLIVFGFLTFLVGLMFVLPLIGHATWHAYRETILPLEQGA